MTAAPGRARLEALARVARTVLDCPDVLKLHTGPTGRISSATNTGRLAGLLLQGQTLTIGVLARPSVTNAEVSASIRAAVRPLVPGAMVINVVVSSASRAPEENSLRR